MESNLNRQELTEDNLVLVTDYKVISSDTDMEARIRPGTLVNLFIQSAIKSADSLGFGFGGLRQQQLFWVLSRMTVEIQRPLKWYEEVEVETWPKDINGLLYLRDYLIRDEQKNVVAKATSGWLAIDLETKRPKKIDGIHAGIFIHLKEKHGVKELPEKLIPLKEGESFDIKTTYFDIDLNKHVTSTRYIDWIMDTFDPDFHTRHYPKRLTINYLKETMPGETIRLTRHQSGEKQFDFEGINSGNNSVAFRGKVGF